MKRILEEHHDLDAERAVLGQAEGDGVDADVRGEVGQRGAVGDRGVGQA
jgi:hypothetical protein